MKKKSSIFIKIIVIISVIIILLAGIVIYQTFGDLKEEDKLIKEIVNVSNKNIYKDDYDIKVVSDGDYAYIEEAIKKYYKEISDNAKELNKLKNDNNLKNIVETENIIKYRPNYLQNHQILNTNKEKLKNITDNINRLCTKKTIKNLLDKNKFKDYKYSYSIFENLMYTDKDIEEIKKIKNELNEVSTNLNKTYDKMDEILKFFEENNELWNYEENNFIFQNEELLQKYNTLFADLSALLNNLK